MGLFDVIGSVIGGLSEAKAAKQAGNEAKRIEQLKVGNEAGNRDETNYWNNQLISLIKEMNAQKLQRADKQQGITQEGYTDAEGNRVQYVAGQGWVTTPSAINKSIIDAEKQDNLQKIAVDSSRARDQRTTNSLSRMKQTSAAEALLPQLIREGYNADAIRGNIATSRRSGINEGFDRTQANATRQALRTGSNAGGMVAKLARERAGALKDVDAGAYLDSLTAKEQLETSRMSRLGTAYNGLSDRGSQIDKFDYTPSTTNKDANELAKGNTSIGVYAGQYNPTDYKNPSIYTTNSDIYTPDNSKAAGTLARGNMGKAIANDVEDDATSAIRKMFMS